MNQWRDNRKSSLESVKSAIGALLIDFKNWSMPDTKAFSHWKGLAVKDAIKVAPTRMIDDIEGMLSKYRQQETDKGFVAPLPIMIIALAPMVSPPDISSLKGIPYWLDTMVPTDPKNRAIKLRTIAKQFRVQVAFVAAEGDTCQGVINQFCAYMQDDFKRRITARYTLGDGVEDDWHLTVIDNSLFPDSVPTGQNNMSVATVDFQLAGLLPQVVGLANDEGYDEYGDGVDPGGREPSIDKDGQPQEWSVIVEADVLNDEANPSLALRASANKDTGERKIEVVER